MEPVALSLRTMQRDFEPGPGASSAPAKAGTKRYAWAAAVVALICSGLAVSTAGHRIWKAFRYSPTAQAVLPNEATELCRQGHGYLLRFDRTGNSDKALEAFQKALALERDSAAAYAGLGLAYAQKYADNPDPQWLRLARSNADQAVQLNSLLSEAHVSLGRVDLVAKDYPRAEKEFRRALELESKNADAQLNLGDSLARQRRSGEAEAAYHRLMETHPDDWRAYHYLGGLLNSSGRYEEAVSYFDKASGLAPDNIAVYKILGAVYHKLDRDVPEGARNRRQRVSDLGQPGGCLPIVGGGRKG
jgi:Flp pilus assembly protein TadD